MSKDALQELRDALGNSALGLLDASCVSYIRQVRTEQGDRFALFAADGTQIALFDSHEAAYFTARQHDLDPLSVH